jgi:hypothetical protein
MRWLLRLCLPPCPPSRAAQLWFYEGKALVAQRSYLDSVQRVQLNLETAAVLTEGRVTLHPLQVGRRLQLAAP